MYEDIVFYRDFTEDEIMDITPCLSHGFLIDQTRNIPLTPEPDPSQGKIHILSKFSIDHG